MSEPTQSNTKAVKSDCPPVPQSMMTASREELDNIQLEIEGAKNSDKKSAQIYLNLSKTTVSVKICEDLSWPNQANCIITLKSR
ncbi:hypothetical protein [Microseira wollei]|uniref:Uncharacterized protein n=1 Tax=Microseira wollei NIES-4236 TaxID=2530354 RepID=A0AAV3WIX2_9CYAN|nr:hypothetical protein [Microseira wollei]GET39714.1 hypothetical protein MiSe_44860 [Microseira wollei NIES-4236]